VGERGDGYHASKVAAEKDKLAVNVGMRVVEVSPILLVRGLFLLWLLKPISGELVKEEHPSSQQSHCQKINSLIRVSARWGGGRT
jgi:hypothetical protein